MDSAENKGKTTKYISFLYDNQLPSFTQFSLLSFQNSRFSDFVEGLILLLEFVQLIAQSLLLNPASYDNHANEPDPDYIQGIMYFAKVFLPGYWISYEDGNSSSLIILFIVFALMMLKFLLFGYVVALAYRGIRRFEFLLKLWGIIFKIQGRILCILLTSFWANAIVAVAKQGVNLKGVSNSVILAIGLILIIWEYAFSFFLQIKVCYHLPTKNLLSAKSNNVESLTLFQKIFLQILQMLLCQASWATNTWTFVTINLVLSFFRDAEFYATLPLYNPTALKLQSILLVLVNSLNISSFFQAFVETLGDDEPDMSFIMIVWVVVGILAIKLSDNWLNKKMANMATSPFTHGSTKLLIHKVIATKDLRKEWDGSNPAKGTNQESYLMCKSVNANAVKALNLDANFAEENEVDINCKDSMHKMLLNYIEKLLIKYPKDSFIKLYLAYFYAKKLNCFGVALRLITELQQLPASRIHLSASVLINEIQTSIRAQYKLNDDKIDMLTYINSQSQLAVLKDSMLEQADFQVNFYKETISENPDLSKLYDISQQVKKYQSKIQKKIKQFLVTAPEVFFEPIMLFSQYFFRLNHAVSDYMEYLKLYARKYDKFGRYFKEDVLTPENLYQEGNIFLTLSGRKGEAGKILYCSKSAAQLFGGDPNLYPGTLLSAMVPPSYAEVINERWRHAAEKGDYASVRNNGLMNFYNKDGYLTIANSHVSIHPFMTHGFYINVVLRPVASNLQFILVRENGDIECATKKVAEKLGLLMPRTSAVVRKHNLSSLSTELKKANQAFNIAALKAPRRESEGSALKQGKGLFDSEDETHHRRANSAKKQTVGTNILQYMAKHKENKPDTMKDIEAEELYSLYRTSGKELWLTSLGNNQGKGSVRMDQQKAYEFNCKISNLQIGPVHLNMISLQEMQKNRGAGGGTELTDQEDGKPDSGAKLQQQSLKETEMFQDHEDSDEFKSENEKQQGWIDFGILSSPDRYATPTTQPIYMTTALGVGQLTTNEGLLLSPLNSPTSTAPLKFSVRSQFGPLHQPQQPKSPLLTFSHRQTNSQSMKGDNVPSPSMRRVQESKRRVVDMKELMAEGSVHDSSWSKTSQKKKISNAYQTALNLKFYSKQFAMFLVLFYLILFGVFLAQWILHLNIDSTINNVLGKKDILSYAQETNFCLVQLTGMFRALENLEGNKFTPAELGSIYGPPLFYLSFAVIMADNLIQANQALMETMTNSTDVIRNDYFEANIRLYDNYFDSADQTYVLLDSFASTNRIIQKSLQIIAIQQVDTTKGTELFSQLYRNSLNDLIIQNQKISVELSESVTQEEQQVDVISNQNLIITICIISGLTVLISLAIWKLYMKEKMNLTSVIRLKTMRIQDALHMTHEFIRIVNADELFLKDNSDNTLVESTRRKAKDDRSGKVGITRENSKVPKSKGILMRYLTHLGKTYVLAAVLVGVIVWSAILVKDSTKFFHTKQEQTYFVEYLRVRSYILQIAAQELLSAPNEALIENIEIEPWMLLNLENLQNLRIKASTIFANNDGTYDTDLENVLYNDGCLPIMSSQAMFCGVLASKGMSRGLIYLLTSYQNLITTRLERYQNSDKSAQAKRDIEGLDIELLVALSIVITEQCTYIRDYLNTKTSENLDTSSTHKNIAIAVSSFAVFTLAIVFWVYIFKALREAYNKFKNVLRIIPPDLVLSSFLLKNFLIKTSNGALDFIKNEI